jgi:Zn-dependent peptidase ImmA (M78 family)
MSNLAFRLKIAKQKGEAVARERGYSALPVDPIEIAKASGIEVQANPDSAEGVSGMLLRHGDTFGILYATYLNNEGFERFSVGHELGHYFLDGHIDHVLPKDGTHESRAGFVSSDPYELEADNFSASLLMPGTPFKRELNRRAPGLETVEFLAGKCRTSITATAIRCAELSSDAIAVIVSTGNAIDYCILSDAMKSLPQLTWLCKGFPVPKNTETSRFSANTTNVKNGARAANETDVLDWLGGTRSAIVTEEVIGLARYGKTLTVLSSESIGQETAADEDEDEEDMVERWTPRFRR